MREEPPNLHDQAVRVGELRVAVEYALTDRIGLQLQAPIKLMNTAITYRRLDGTAFVPDWVGIHHRDETLVGVTDPWLTGRIAGELAEFALVGRLGLSLPLGSTVPNPFVAGHEGLEHQHFQFGTGTVNPIVAGEIARRFGEWTASGHLLAMLVPYENGYGFQAGHRLAGGVSVGGELVGKLGGMLGIDVVHEAAERWDGVVQQDGNLGRTDVLAAATLSYPVGEQVFTLSVRTPVYQRVVGGQVSYPAIVSLGVERVFGAK